MMNTSKSMDLPGFSIEKLESAMDSIIDSAKAEKVIQSHRLDYLYRNNNGAVIMRVTGASFRCDRLRINLAWNNETMEQEAILVLDHLNTLLESP